MSVSDRAYTGPIPSAYDQYLVPLIFEPYAVDLARRLGQRSPERVLELAAGTGVVTRTLAATLPPRTSIVASDLNQAMVDFAMAMPIARPVEWRLIDAQQLPFEDASFDAVVCQFGSMFFPDRPKAFGEARRVLRPGGVFIFSVWDRIDQNEFADVITTALAELFPADPPRFLARGPHGYHERSRIAQDVAAGGFEPAARIETVTARSRADSARVPVLGFCQGTPLRSEIEARDPSGLDRAIDAATAAIASRFGTGAVDAKIQAHVVTVER